MADECAAHLEAASSCLSELKDALADYGEGDGEDEDEDEGGEGEETAPPAAIRPAPVVTARGEKLFVQTTDGKAVELNRDLLDILFGGGATKSDLARLAADIEDLRAEFEGLRARQAAAKAAKPPGRKASPSEVERLIRENVDALARMADKFDFK